MQRWWVPPARLALFVAVAGCPLGCGPGDDVRSDAGRATDQERVMQGLPRIASGHWGVTPAGDSVTLYTLRNANGMRVDVADLGGIVTRVQIPGPDGEPVDVVLGYDSLAAYVEDSLYLGATVGRYANRIADGQFELDGKTHQVTVNEGLHHLHGGELGFGKVVWDAFAVESGPVPGSALDVPGAGRAAVALSYISEDGEEGFPGRLEVGLTISLTGGNELRFDYEAQTSAPTVLNLTHHDYWNLGGHDGGTAEDHELALTASRFTPVGPDLLPSGELLSVVGTPFDFRAPARIGDRIDANHAQLDLAGGFDHNFALDAWTGDGALHLAARLRDPESGREMEVRTTEPGLQLYTMNRVDGPIAGKSAARYTARQAVCLEAQHFPDSPNHAEFPSTVLRPGETFRSTTVYRFRIPLD